jgi:NitT/TauT family transport system permease protein
MAARLKPARDAIIGIVIAFIVWETSVRVFKIQPFLLPTPSSVLLELFDKWPLLVGHTVQTIVGTLLSLIMAAVLGVALGFIIGYSKPVSRMFYPLLGAFNALPKSAFIPILAIWFGIGFMPRLLAGFLIAFFPIVVNIVTGLNTIEPDLWDMLRVIGATKVQVFTKVGIPRTIPYFFAALKVAVTGAFIGNVVGEMLASGVGLGYVLLVATSQLNMRLAFAILTILFLLGLFLFVVADEVEKVAAPWAYRGPEIPMVSQ